MVEISKECVIEACARAAYEAVRAYAVATKSTSPLCSWTEATDLDKAQVRAGVCAVLAGGQVSYGDTLTEQKAKGQLFVTAVWTMTEALHGALSASDRPLPEIHFLVNRKSTSVRAERVTYDEVVVAAGFDPARTLTVVYRRAGHNPVLERDGTLCPGDKALLSEGMRFTVVDTSGA